MIQIFVRTLTGRTLPLQIDSKDSVDSLKAKIQDKVGILFNKQRLIFARKQLQRGRALGDYKIEKDCTIKLNLDLRAGREKLLLDIKSISGKIFSLEVEPSDSIDYIKEVLSNNENVSTRHVRLVLKGKLLENGRAVFDYNLEDNSLILMFFIFPGG